MDALWPWLAVVGAGAAHGLNPLAGWGPALALTDRRIGARALLGALAPIAIGHLVAVVLSAMAIARGLPVPREGLFGLAAVGLVGIGIQHWRGRRRPSPPRSRSPLPGAQAWSLALWSFLAATAHGAGLMLLPALAPVCSGAMAGRELTASGSLALAMLVVAVHAAAMLVTITASGLVARRVWRLAAGWRARRQGRRLSAPCPGP